jgi:hypothetical protein
MLNIFMLVTVLVLLGILGVLLDIAWNLRGACRRLDQCLRCLFVVKTPDPHHGKGIQHVVAFSIWCFENGKWTLLCHCGQPGCDCGPPPTKPGSYEGQVVRKECAAR